MLFLLNLLAYFFVLLAKWISRIRSLEILLIGNIFFSIPAVQIFCIYTGVAITITFIYQVSHFLFIFVLK